MKWKYSLEDADNCIANDPGNWKAHYWKASAIANLIKTGKRPRAMEAAGLASASIAGYLNPEIKRDLKMNMLYPVLNIRVVTNPRRLMNEVLTVSNQPCTALLLRKGRYNVGPFQAAKNIQVIGTENEVEIFFEHVLQIFPPNKEMHLGGDVPEEEIQVHFENIRFVKGAGQIIATSGTTLIFYRCKFSNSREACDDYPHCKGGRGCKNPNPNDCLAQFEEFNETRGSGHFLSGKGGSPAVCAVQGGQIILDNFILDGCGGGGALSNGKGSVLKATKCTIINNHQSGLEARNGGELFATDNVIKNNHHHGILLGPYGKGFVANNVISGNSCEGIYCCEPDVGPGDVVISSSTGPRSTAVLEDNIISHNGLCGISTDGGTYLMNKNRIFDNWCWGIMAKTRASCHLTNNDIYTNICGGVRIGFNYSATLFLDGNTIRDHTGPHLYILDFPLQMKPFFQSAKSTDLLRSNLRSCGMPDDEVTQYTSPPIVTNRNVFRHNDMRIQHPSEELVVANTCAFCHKNCKNITCGSCAKVFYCNRECQTNHWRRHKHFCKMFNDKFTVSVEIKNTRPFMRAGPGEMVIRQFEPSLKGIREGPKPDRESSKRFIVKIQSGPEYSRYDPQTYILLYDRSVDVDIEFCNPQLYHLIMECGILAGNTYTTKKIFCWASFEEKGKILKVYTDNLPPFQTW